MRQPVFGTVGRREGGFPGDHKSSSSRLTMLISSRKLLLQKGSEITHLSCRRKSWPLHQLTCLCLDQTMTLVRLMCVGRFPRAVYLRFNLRLLEMKSPYKSQCKSFVVIDLFQPSATSSAYSGTRFLACESPDRVHMELRHSVNHGQNVLKSRSFRGRASSKPSLCPGQGSTFYISKGRR